MKNEPEIFFHHILEAISDLEVYTYKMTKRQFIQDRKTQDAVIRKLEIIGEAVKNLRPMQTSISKDIPWKQIASMRDILIHEYFGIDLDIVWSTVKKNIPPLKRAVQKVLEMEKSKL